MLYNELIENICIRYFKILKNEAKIPQKEIAKYIGISDCLISKWKNRNRRISAEYYKNIQNYFVKQEFDPCFERHRRWLLQHFDDVDAAISPQEFWEKLFQGQLKSNIVSMDTFIEILHLILKERSDHRYSVEMITKTSQNKCVEDKRIQITNGDKSLEVSFDDMDTLAVRSERKRLMIDRQQLKSLNQIHLFRVVCSYDITEKQLIFLNQCAEKVEECLKAL